MLDVCNDTLENVVAWCSCHGPLTHLKLARKPLLPVRSLGDDLKPNNDCSAIKHIVSPSTQQRKRTQTQAQKQFVCGRKAKYTATRQMPEKQKPKEKKSWNGGGFLAAAKSTSRGGVYHRRTAGKCCCLFYGWILPRQSWACWCWCVHPVPRWKQPQT